jgi:1-acyl-sn-glycerol-3-phosphate acyltransferase
MPYWIIRPIAWVLLRISFFLLGGIRFEGRENVPRSGGVLILSNHISDCDPPAIAVALPRDCWFMAKEEIFAMPVVGALSRWLHGFGIKRNTADRAALRKAEELLKAGNAVVIFPEGKLSEDGKLQPLLPGALLVARAAGVPVVPTVLIGSDRIIPYGSVWPRPTWRKTIIRFGPALTVAELFGGEKGGEALKRGAVRLGECMRALQEGRPYPEE